MLTITGIATPVGSRIYRNRVPQASEFPYIVVGDGHDIDFGRTTRGHLDRELGSYSIIVASTKSFDEIDAVTDAIIETLAAFKNGYIPSANATHKMWVQCFFLKDRRQFNYKPVDGNETPFLGYIIPIRSGYDAPLAT